MALKEIRQKFYQAKRKEFLKYSTSNFADLLDCNIATYYNKESNPNKYLSMEDAKKIAKYLDCNVEDLFY